MSRVIRMAIASIGLAVGLAIVSPVLATPAGAAQQVAINIDDFRDPVTGKINVEAYLQALAAQNSSGPSGTSGSLPYTGSSTADFVAVGLGAVAVGAVMVGVSRARRSVA